MVSAVWGSPILKKISKIFFLQQLTQGLSKAAVLFIFTLALSGTLLFLCGNTKNPPGCTESPASMKRLC